jgi:hypothetical protein
MNLRRNGKKLPTDGVTAANVPADEALAKSDLKSSALPRTEPLPNYSFKDTCEADQVITPSVLSAAFSEKTFRIKASLSYFAMP